jgi:hypothetical protein
LVKYNKTLLSCVSSEKKIIFALFSFFSKMNNKLDINPDRPLLVGPETPSKPFPFALQGTVVKGYGRGSKQLGIPTGNTFFHIIPRQKNTNDFSLHKKLIYLMKPLTLLFLV